MKKHKKMPAKELTEKRRDIKDLLLAHDVKGFRHFLLKDGDALIESDVRALYLKLDDIGLSTLMHQIKSQQPYLGDAFQESRNFFRVQRLEETLKDPAVPENPALKAEIEVSGAPLCVRCVYFRKPPEGEEKPCMHQGALPGDVACAGWTQLPCG